jgi:hypothetical protein
MWDSSTWITTSAILDGRMCVGSSWVDAPCSFFFTLRNVICGRREFECASGATGRVEGPPRTIHTIHDTEKNWENSSAGLLPLLRCCCCCVNVHKVKSQEETGSFPRHITGTQKKPQIPHSWLLTTENRVVGFYCSDTAMTVDQGRAKIHGAVSKGVARVHHLTPEAGHH